MIDYLLVKYWHFIGLRRAKQKNMKQIIIKKTFIVDDDPFWAEILRQMLNDLGYTNIYIFTSGQECINNLHLKPNLVFLDYHMDDLDGLQVLQIIKENYVGTGVVFCTAEEDLSLTINAMKYGSNDFVIKSNACKEQLEQILEEMKEKQIFADKIL